MVLCLLIDFALFPLSVVSLQCAGFRLVASEATFQGHPGHSAKHYMDIISTDGNRKSHRGWGRRRTDLCPPLCPLLAVSSTQSLSRYLLHAVSSTQSPEQKYSPMHMLRKTSQGSIKKGYFFDPKCPISRLLGYLLFWQRHSFVYSFSFKNYYSSDIFLIDKLIPLLLVPMHFSSFRA